MDLKDVINKYKDMDRIRPMHATEVYKAMMSMREVSPSSAKEFKEQLLLWKEASELLIEKYIEPVGKMVSRL